jgi:hypothetical protein
MRSRLWRAAAYGFAVMLFLLLGLELACRLGVVPNAAEALRRRARLAGPHGRALILGDSFSLESPDEQSLTLGNQLRHRLAARGVAVVNLSVQGFGPLDELETLRMFQKDAGDYRPNVVMVNYYVGNDLTDTLFRLRGHLSRVGLLRYRGGEWLQRSFLLRFLSGWQQDRQVNADARRIRRTQMQLLLAVPLPAAQHAVNPYLVDLAHVLPEFLQINLLLQGRAAELAWDENQRVLREIRQYAESVGARLVINIFPHTLQVDDSHYAFFQDLGFRMDRAMLATTAPQDRLKAFCTAEKLTCNDLLPELRAHREELFMPNDDHWLTPGHTLAADVIEKQVAPLFFR